MSLSCTAAGAITTLTFRNLMQIIIKKPLTVGNHALYRAFSLRQYGSCTAKIRTGPVGLYVLNNVKRRCQTP